MLLDFNGGFYVYDICLLWTQHIYFYYLFDIELVFKILILIIIWLNEHTGI
jgi:hypothetical protein